MAVKKRMKLIREVEFNDSLEDAHRLLQSKGIAVRVANEKSKGGKPSLVGFRRGVWVLSDDQYEDAKVLLRDPGHQPGFVLSAEEAGRLQSEADTQLGLARTQSRYRVIYFVLMVFLLVLGLLFFF